MMREIAFMSENLGVSFVLVFSAIMTWAAYFFPHARYVRRTVSPDLLVLFLMILPNIVMLLHCLLPLVILSNLHPLQLDLSLRFFFALSTIQALGQVFLVGIVLKRKRTWPAAVEDSDVSSIGYEMKRRREEQGLKMKQVAKAADLPHHIMAEIESGRMVPTLPELVRIAHALRVSVSTLTTSLEKNLDSDRPAGGDLMTETSGIE
ncbi:MAG: helix-turn-helix domain-containing protein [Planctomycetia bacterium]